MAQATRTPIAKHLGDETEYLLDHECETIPKDQLHLPGSDFV
ncbi:MAG: fructose-bisphosphate aldolase, partial [Bacteroidetes bacterium QS_1_63_11]